VNQRALSILFIKGAFSILFISYLSIERITNKLNKYEEN